jgi:hypothetical protein
VWNRFREWFGAGAAGVALGFAAALLAGVATARRAEVALPVRIVVGAPPGPSPMARVDAARSGRADELPDSPLELWHRTVRGGVELPVAVGEGGAVVAATAIGEVVQLGADGAEQWRARLGASTISAGPALTSDGTRVLLTSLGEAWGLSAAGAVKFRTELGGYGRDPRAAPLPRDDGSVVVAIARHLLVLGDDGAVRDHATTTEPIVGALVGSRHGVLATTESGGVLAWSSPLAPRAIGSFGGSVRDGAALADEQTLMAVADLRRLVGLDLRTGATTARASLFGLQGPPAIGPRGAAYAVTLSGVLVGASASAELLRVALDPVAVAAEDGGVSSAPIVGRAVPPMLADRVGRVAFVRGDGRVGVVSPDGRVALAATTACYDPTAMAPLGRGRFVVACRGGSVRAYGR